MPVRTVAEKRLYSEDPYAHLLRECLESAVHKDASDIHIEPKEDSLLIRFRINGRMKIWKTVGPDHADSIIWRAKWIVGLDLSVVGRPQDGRATFNVLGVDIRANAIPTLYGTKLVFRILPHTSEFSLEKSKLSSEVKTTLQTAVSKNQGLIVISGPTGSGKTTTLYSLLNIVDSSQKNICTVENPVEYRLPGITQVDISERGMSFPEAMRAMLRQDPDVILLGEIRDPETAAIATQAAGTGHLVLSTIHTNSAAEVASRLIQLGIDRWTIESTLIAAMAQRLVPALCQECSLLVTDEYTDSTFSKNAGLRLTNPRGCKNCEAGVTGRHPIAEIFESDLLPKILSGGNDYKSKRELFEQARHLAEGGMIDYREALALA